MTIRLIYADGHTNIKNIPDWMWDLPYIKIPIYHSVFPSVTLLTDTLSPLDGMDQFTFFERDEFQFRKYSRVIYREVSEIEK